MKNLMLIFISTAFFLSTTSVIASPIRFNFTGDVTSVNPDTNSPTTFEGEFNTTFNTSQKLSGFFIFDSTTPDTNTNIGDPDLATYVLTDISFTIGSYTGGASLFSTYNQIQIINATAGNGFFGDLYNPHISSPIGLEIASVSPEFFDIDFINTTTKTALTDDSLPLAPPLLSSFDSTTWSLTFNEPNTEGSAFRHIVSGTITSLTTNVPEPSSILLVGLGLVTCYSGRNRRLSTRASLN